MILVTPPEININVLLILTYKSGQELPILSRYSHLGA